MSGCIIRRRRCNTPMEGSEHDYLYTYIRTYSLGDGVTRYRFFTEPHNSYFGPQNGIYTALGYAEANTFLTGYARAMADSEANAIRAGVKAAGECWKVK